MKEIDARLLRRIMRPAIGLPKDEAVTALAAAAIGSARATGMPRGEFDALVNELWEQWAGRGDARGGFDA